MDYSKDPAYDLSSSLELLRIHKAANVGRVDEGILVDHLKSLKHGLQFFSRILEYAAYEDLKYPLIERINHTVSNVKQKLYYLRYHGKDENLDHAYAELREQMTNVMMKPESNEYDVMFLDISNRWYKFASTNKFLCENIFKLAKSDLKLHQIAPMNNELKEIFKLLTSFLEPFFMYATAVEWKSTPNEEEKKIFATIATVLDKAACFIYLSLVGKMDDDMVLAMKNNLSGLIIEEPQIMKMYLILDTYSSENLVSHLSMSMRLLAWNKKCYLGTEMGATLEEHFMSIKHGLNFLVHILLVSENKDVEGGILHLVSIAKQKLYSLTDEKEDGIQLEHAYGELREAMQNVVIKDYNSLFPEIFSRAKAKEFSKIKDFLLHEIRKLVTSKSKASQVNPVMEELEELRKKLTSLNPLFNYASANDMKEGEEYIFDALTTFLEKATCLVYLSFIGNLNEDMLVSLRKNFSLLIEEAEMKQMFEALGIVFEGDLESDIDISLSLLKRQEENIVGTIHEAMSKDHIMSLKHGIEFLKWFLKIYNDKDLKLRIILLAGNVKRKLESLTYKHEDANGAYADLREEMKNLIINQSTDGYGNLFPDFFLRFPNLRENNDFLIEKIRTLVTSDCKADEIAPLKKELQDLRNMVSSFKPLGHYLDYGIIDLGDGERAPFLTMYHKATLLVYLSFVGKMDTEMMISVRSNISATIKETRVLKMYTAILRKKILVGKRYGELEVYLIENLTWLLKSNVGSLNDANSKLYEALVDTHGFLLSLPPNVFLRKLHLLKKSFEDILHHTIPVVYSCYLEHAEVDIYAELNRVLDLIMHMKSEAQEMKLYYFPRTDDLGFLEFFSGYLEDLRENQEIATKEEIDALHVSVESLLSLAKLTNEEEFDESPWNDIINLAYQAEYTIDLYLVSSCRDSGLLSSLSKIIEQLKKIRADFPAQNLAVTSEPTQVSDNDTIVDLQEEDWTITDSDARLSEDGSWELFQKKMLHEENLPDHLLKIAKGIVKNCNGLALSIVMVAGILSSVERTEEKWNQLAEGLSSFTLSDTEGKCNAIVETNYYQLPNHLRPCVLYLGLFPEDREIQVDDLINLWIGEGLVRDTKSEKAEEVGKKYMENLIVKSYMIRCKVRSGGGVKAFRVHHLLRDFCLKKAKEEHFFTMLDKRNRSKRSRPLQDPRRLIINDPMGETNYRNFSGHSVRSMICFDGLEASEIEEGIKSYDMVLLRVLAATKVRGQHFPDLSTLVHLRYMALGLERPSISVLPSSISKLHNLQILILRCFYGIKVPDFIWDMVKLRHVNISPGASFQVDSKRLENSSVLLKNLTSLSKALVTWDDSKWLSKLLGLETLSCEFVEYQLTDKQFPLLSFNDHLISLKVANECFRSKRFMRTCQLPKSLRELTLSRFFLESNDISEIGRAVPHLEVLKIYSCSVPSGYEWNVKDEDFPGLKVLKLKSLEFSKWIVSEDSFPSLEQLWVEKCDDLVKIPLAFGSLPKLRLISVKYCAPSVEKSARKIEKQNPGMSVRVQPKN